MNHEFEIIHLIFNMKYVKNAMHSIINIHYLLY